MSSLCDYSDPYILAYLLVKGTISVANNAATAAAASNKEKKLIFKNCAQFADWISEIHNKQINNTKDFHILKPMYNLKQFNDNYSKITKFTTML